MDAFEELRKDLRAFVDERDWDQFHAPKDLAVGLAVEAGELLEHFQWRDPGADEVRADAKTLSEIRDEVADCFLYAILVADKLGFDVLAAAHAKLAKNRAKYPVEKARGNPKKYTEH
ncbi:MAG TPA: nucleotide pyrophosphohydrolase [Candidatus Thermoplasmatota archaeon]|nr:nucleotide pyrophosphohydrolase [Candidatus Thermoplasmatota archaeon]